MWRQLLDLASIPFTRVSMSTPVQSDTAIGIDKLPPITIHGESRDKTVRNYTRVAQHYITNNNTSIAPTVTGPVTNAASSLQEVNFASYYYAIFDQGYVNIPFTSTSMAMDATDWDAIQMDCSSFRVKGCGFSIERITCSQQTVSSNSSTTQITNQFTQAPVIMMIKDLNHELATMGTVQDTSGTPSDLYNVIAAPGNSNKSFPHSFSAGALPKVKWLQPCSAGTTNFNPEVSFDILKGGDIKLLSTSDTYSYHWENPDHHRWQMPMLAGNGDSLNDETVRHTDYYLPAGSESITALIQQNLATNVNRNLLEIPCNHFLRVPPLYTQVDAVTVSMELWIKYHMEIEYFRGNYLTTRNVTGSDASCLAGNLLPLPQFRRPILAFAPSNVPGPTAKRRKDTDQQVPNKKRPRDQTDGAAVSLIPKAVSLISPKSKYSTMLTVDDDDDVE